MSRLWRWLLPCYLLLGLNAIIAFVYAHLWCRARQWEWRDGVLTFIAGVDERGYGRMLGNPGGQGWSWIVGYASEQHREKDSLRVHENVHVVQEFVCALAGAVFGGVVGLFGPWHIGLALGLVGGGVLFALAYGVLFLGYYLTKQKDEQPGWHDDYKRNPFERQAYRIQDEFERGLRPNAWGSD